MSLKHAPSDKNLSWDRNMIRKYLKKLPIFALVLIFSIFTGCNSFTASPPPSPSPSETVSIEPSPKDEPALNIGASFRSELNLTKGHTGKTLKYWTWTDLTSNEANDLARFESLTGCTVEHTKVDYITYRTALEEAVGSGSGPDLVVLSPDIMLGYVQYGLVLPVSDYLDMSALGLTQAEGVKRFYSVGGKQYTLCGYTSNSGKLFFRRDYFADEGIDNPYELYQKGQWTWDAFVTSAKAVTYTKGKNKVWGYYSWSVDQVLYSNGANYIDRESGSPIFGLTDPKALAALKWERELDTKHGIVPKYDASKDPLTMLVDGTIAMLYWDDWALHGENGLIRRLEGNLGVAPFPKGPDSVTGFGDTAAPDNRLAIAACSTEPELAALFMLYTSLPVRTPVNNIEPDNVFTTDEAAMMLEMANYAVVNPVSAYVGLQNEIDIALNNPELSPQDAVNYIKDAAQAIIDNSFEN